MFLLHNFIVAIPRYAGYSIPYVAIIPGKKTEHLPVGGGGGIPVDDGGGGTPVDDGGGGTPVGDGGGGTAVGGGVAAGVASGLSLEHIPATGNPLDAPGLFLLKILHGFQ